MRVFRSFSKVERVIFAIAFVIASACLVLFCSDALFWQLFGHGEYTNTSEKIGQIAILENDVRFKSARTFEWDHARKALDIHLGDAVFCGEDSTADIALGKGRSIAVGANSLVRFSQIEGQKLSDLKLGSFRLKVDGEMKVAINGVPTVITGKQSEAVLSIAPSGAQVLKIVKGEVTLETVNKVTGKSRKTIVSKAPKRRVAPAGPDRAEDNSANEVVSLEEIPQAPVVQSPPVPVVLASLFNYRLHLYEVYSTERGLLVPRKQMPSQKVKLPVTLAWETSLPQTVELQQSTDSNFAQDVRSELTQKQSLIPAFVFIGQNFWRVRSGESAWSKTQAFEVATTFIPGSPHFVDSKSLAYLLEDRVNSHLSWTAPAEESSGVYVGYIVERSLDPEFPAEQTDRWWRKTADIDLSFNRAANYYLRVRAVNEHRELTEFSEHSVVEVVSPARLRAPVLLSMQGTPPVLAWKDVKEASGYTLELRKGRQHKRYSLKETHFDSSQLKTDDYNFRIAAIDRWGREGEFTERGLLSVKRVQAPKLPVLSLKKTEPVREPAQVMSPKVVPEPAPPARAPVMSAAIKVKEPEIVGSNETYKLSHLQIEGSNVVLVSNIERGRGLVAPLAAGTGLRLLNWFTKSSGSELSAKAQVFGYNETGRAMAPTALEARYLRRWLTPWRWYSFLRELQVTGIAAIESYRNANANSFASAYDVAKLGFNLEFPLGRRWDTGGEALGGLTTDKSRKFELSGHLHYNFGKQFSFGLGYRVHLFDAASIQSSPVNSLPYREAYGEGYSVLRLAY